MREFCSHGSVRGAPGNWRPYRDTTVTDFPLRPKRADARDLGVGSRNPLSDSRAKRESQDGHELKLFCI